MSGTGLLARLFGSSTPGEGAAHRDGEAHALEALATGITTGQLDPDTPGPSEPKAVTAGGRRGRPLALPQDVLVEEVAQKVLHGWLQNRHQTLYPLTVNLRTLEPTKAALLTRMMATVMLAGTRAPGEVRVAVGLTWLGQAGGQVEGSEGLDRVLRSALETPEPLSSLLRDIQKAGLTAYAYVVSIMAADLNDESERRFLDYLAVRLALPANVVRSADRRYRGAQPVAPASVSPASAP